MAFIDDEGFQRMAVRSLMGMLNPQLKEAYADKKHELYINFKLCEGCTIQHPHVIVGCQSDQQLETIVTWCAEAPNETVVVLDRFLSGQEWQSHTPPDGVELIPRFCELPCTTVMRSGNCEDSDVLLYKERGAFAAMCKTSGNDSSREVMKRVRAQLSSLGNM
jgi:hypothetical protein